MVINYSCTVNVPNIVDLTLVARYKITRPKARNPLRIVRKSGIVRNIPFDFHSLLDYYTKAHYCLRYNKASLNKLGL